MSEEVKEIDDWLQTNLNVSAAAIRFEEDNPATARKNTRTILPSLLSRIDNAGKRQVENHADYNAFVVLQVEVLKHILHCEEMIQISRTKNKAIVKPLKERRAALKLLGSTIAWRVLGLDRHYIRNVGAAADSGYLVGKEGTPAEIEMLRQFHRFDNSQTVLLHGITHCLRSGDVTRTNGRLHVPQEVMLVKSRNYRMNSRKKKQVRKIRTILEFLAEGKSLKLRSDAEVLTEEHDVEETYHWPIISRLMSRAKLSPTVEFPELGLAYIACKYNNQTSSLVDWVGTTVDWKNDILVIGSQDKHLDGLPGIMPFTLFDIPMDAKESLLLGRLKVAAIVNLSIASKTLNAMGIQSIAEEAGLFYYKRKKDLIFKVDALEGRLTYEFLSMQTMYNWIKKI